MNSLLANKFGRPGTHSKSIANLKRYDSQESSPNNAYGFKPSTSQAHLPTAEQSYGTASTVILPSVGRNLVSHNSTPNISKISRWTKA